MSLLMILIFISSITNAQQFDKKLEKFKSEIVQSFKEYGEIANNQEEDAVQYKFLHSRRLAIVNPKIIYFEIGRMTSHGYKFLAVYNNDKITVYPSKDFNADFIKIISPLENVKIIKINVFELFKTIKSMYDYNVNPSWDRLH